MNRQAFIAKHRPRLLGWLTDAWASRRTPPSEFGAEVDRQFSRLNELLGVMFDDLQPKPESPAQPKGKTP